MFLSELQLYALTRKKHHSAQVQVLNALGIPYIKRPDGSLVVSEQHIQRLLGVDVNNVNAKQVSPD